MSLVVGGATPPDHRSRERTNAGLDWVGEAGAFGPHGYPVHSSLFLATCRQISAFSFVTLRPASSFSHINHVEGCALGARGELSQDQRLGRHRGGRVSQNKDKRRSRKALWILLSPIAVAVVVLVLTTLVTKLMESKGSAPVIAVHRPGIDEFPFKGCASGAFFPGKARADLPRLNPEDDAVKFVTDNGGVPWDTGKVIVTVHGPGEHSIKLHSLAAVMEPNGRKPAIPGVRARAGCGGPEDHDPYFSINLDQKTLKVVAQSGGKMKVGGPPEIVEVPNTILEEPVSAHDGLAFTVQADAHACVCSWHLILKWSSNGEEGSTVIDDKGKPFTTYATYGKGSTETRLSPFTGGWD